MLLHKCKSAEFLLWCGVFYDILYIIEHAIDKGKYECQVPVPFKGTGLQTEPPCQRNRCESKHETSLPKFRLSRKKAGRLKEAEPSGRGSPQDETDASLICLLSDGQQRRECHTLRKEAYRT